MSASAKRKATYADLLAVPEGQVAEIIAGELIVSPRPAIPHSNAGSVLGSDLNGLFHGRGRRGGPGGWWILDEPELHLGEHVLVPDLAGWRQERLPALQDAAYFSLAPDWVCELVSPSTARTDRILKLPIYAEAKIGCCWIVNPAEQSIEAFVLSGAHWLLQGTYGGDQRVRIAPFDAAELDLAELWIAPTA